MAAVLGERWHKCCVNTSMYVGKGGIVFASSGRIDTRFGCYFSLTCFIVHLRALLEHVVAAPLCVR